MKKFHLLPTLLTLAIGVAGLALVLFAWHLPPFSPAQPTTENAYIRGKVTALAPQLSGYIAEVDVSDFQTVHAGDVIARIDDRTYTQALAQAEADLASAKAALEVAKQDLNSAKAASRSSEASLKGAQSALATAKSEWDRVRALSDRGISSQSTADQAELSYNQAEASLAEAEATVEVRKQAIASAEVAISTKKTAITRAEATVELAQIDMDRTVVRAPADGRLGQVSAHVGQYVSAGTTLVSHVGTDVWVIANFKETGLRGVQIGQEVKISVDALDGRVFRGHVQNFSPATASEFSLLSSSNATGNFTKIAQRLPVRISIDPDQDMADALAPGLSVEVEVDTDSTPVQQAQSGAIFG
ncbi:HlyD family secretion protein [Pseudooceanicola nanhaiensis]|uniref:HlyD family secretion protein n=1 Tax=Pseudooceanicola nanhaiensis TaxID=375761 RepID=UPI001CD50345|nr:HlyD family secretion protein [Pseudooceanicola nanhaiensis]MCA0919983.1 HlyD family secretion protein [Pseudooceanicola nanhaiensis]